MYFGQRVFEAGHESAGVNAPSTEWFLAEGATGTFFTTFLLVANPGNTDATVTYTYLPATGLPIVKTRTVAGALALDGQHRDGRRVAGERGGGDAHHVDAAGDRRARAVLAVHARSVVRSAQQLRRHVARPQVGPRRRPRRHGVELSDLHPAGESEHDDGGEVRVTFLKTNGTTVVKDVAVQPTSRFNVEVQRRAGAGERVVRHADRGDRTASASRSSGRCIRIRPAWSGRRARTRSARSCRKEARQLAGSLAPSERAGPLGLTFDPSSLHLGRMSTKDRRTMTTSSGRSRRTSRSRPIG